MSMMKRKANLDVVEDHKIAAAVRDQAIPSGPVMGKQN